MKNTGKKKILGMILAAAVLFSLMPYKVCAADIVNSGICGDNIIWTFDSEGTLRISGSGELKKTDEHFPWNDFRRDIISVVVEDGVTSICDNSFYQMNELKSAIISDSVSFIGENIFGYCEKLETAVIPNGIKSIGDYMFFGCSSLKSITIPDSVTSIGNYSFCMCRSLEKIKIPDNVESIGEQAFVSCSSLKSLTIPDNVKNIGEWAFAVCGSLTDIKLSNGLKSIAAMALCNCKGLIVVTIPEGVENIEGAVFKGCRNLKSVKIPVSVSDIGYAVFDLCDSLESIYYSGSTEQWKKINVEESNELYGVKIYCSDGIIINQPQDPYIINSVTLKSLNGQEYAEIPQDKSFIAEVSVRKTAERSTADYLIVAAYDSNDLLLSMNYSYANIDIQKNYVFGINIPKTDEKIERIKVFVWDSFQTMTPLSEVVTK